MDGSTGGEGAGEGEGTQQRSKKEGRKNKKLRRMAILGSGIIASPVPNVKVAEQRQNFSSAAVAEE